MSIANKAAGLLSVFMGLFSLTLQAADVKVEQAWARVSAPGVPVSAAYMTLQNTAKQADALLSAESPRAASVQIHSTSMDGGVMRMREVEAVELPAGASVKLEPGGLHIMLMGLSAPLVAGETLPLTLKFRHAGTVQLELPVRPRT
jgi:copper(I)-binding protein